MTQRRAMHRPIRTAMLNVSGLCGVVFALAALGNVALWHQPVERASPGLFVWWTTLCAVSVCNIWLWLWSAEALAKRRSVLEPEVFKYQRLQLWLAAIYVLGCAFRALLPRADVQRIGLFD